MKKSFLIVLAILFFPITLLILLYKSVNKNGNDKKNKSNNEITMDEVIDIEELFED